jgi:hypothetical protein
LNRLRLLFSILLLAFHGGSAPLAFIVLDTDGWRGGRLPAGWQVKVNHGTPNVANCAEGEGSCVRLTSDKASFAMERGLNIDLAELPYLTWRWKVTQLPPRGDFRRAATDDQAAQVLVAFQDRRVLSYIWDSNAPQGVEQKTGYIPLVNVFAIVCRSGTEDANRWIAEHRNVAADYHRAYGRPAPRVKAIRIQINSQHTGSVAESYFGDVAFRSMLAE